MKKDEKNTKSRKNKSNFTGLAAESERVFVPRFPTRKKSKRKHLIIGAEKSYDLNRRTGKKSQ